MSMSRFPPRADPLIRCRSLDLSGAGAEGRLILLWERLWCRKEQCKDVLATPLISYSF